MAAIVVFVREKRHKIARGELILGCEATAAHQQWRGNARVALRPQGALDEFRQTLRSIRQPCRWLARDIGCEVKREDVGDVVVRVAQHTPQLFSQDEPLGLRQRKGAFGQRALREDHIAGHADAG